MADLIAIGYDDTTTATQAMDEVGRLAKDLGISPMPWRRSSATTRASSGP